MAVSEPITEYDPKEWFVTDVMPLVAWLMYNSFTPQATTYDDTERRCYWVFPRIPALLEKLDQFHSKQARVEPKHFSAIFGRISRERGNLMRP